MIEKILEQLEEEREYSYTDFEEYVNEQSPCLDAEYDDSFHRGLERAAYIVRKVVKEYDNGWIPVNPDDKDSFPKDDGYIMVSFANFSLPNIARYEEDENGGAFYPGDEDESYASVGLIVNAWRPLPVPYRPEGE